MLSEDRKKMVAYYNKGLSLYKKKKFQEAVPYFKKALELEPGDGPSQLYIARCTELVKNPPPDDWDGVYTMTTK
jgi:tetratricopeptide (TPR) repeat protein